MKYSEMKTGKIEENIKKEMMKFMKIKIKKNTKKMEKWQKPTEE